MKRSALARPLLALLALACALGIGEGLDRGYWLCRRLFEVGATTDVFELYVAGESTAVGQPYGDKLAPGTLVAGQFSGRIGGRPIRLIVVAERSQSIYPQSVALERRLQSRDRRNPAAVLIYSGHNDAGGGAQAPPRAERLRRALTARSALLRDLWYLSELRYPFLRRRSLESWDYHLRRAIEASLRAGATPILTTAVANAADIDPGLTVDDVTPEARALIDRGMRLEASGRLAEALRHYASADRRGEPLRRYLTYRMARCLQALKDLEGAKALYREVVDSDANGNFGRATSWQNARIRALAAEYGVPLADAERSFERRSPHGILGDSLFSDGHHPNVEGYRLLAAAYAAELSTLTGEPIREPLVDETDCLRRGAFGPRDLSEALRASGNWLFSSAARQAYPEQRLTLSGARFRRAYELDAGNFAAWLGLQFVELARRSALLREPEGLDWLGRRGVFYGRGGSLGCETFLEAFRTYDPSGDAAQAARRCRLAARAGR